MKRKIMVYLSVTAIFILAGIFAWNTMARAAYESAEYKVVESDGKFEVREYPDLMLDRPIAVYLQHRRNLIQVTDNASVRPGKLT
jgi:hypothetical protein